MDILGIIQHLLTLILRLYGDPYLLRNIVQTVIDHMTNFIRDMFLPSLKKDVLQALEGTQISESTLKKIENCFKKHANVFEYVDTEAKIFSLLKKRGFIKFETFLIGQTFVDKILENGTILSPENVFGIHVPLRKTMKSFLEIPGVFQEIIQYIEKLNKETHIISNIMQADLWLRKYKNKFINEIVLPLYIFCDELEVGNPLGSHAGTNKYAAVYASIACLPPRLASQLNSIILALLVHAKDHKKFGNKKVFSKLVEELNFLRTEGIFVNVGGMKRKVKFQLILILGDNLGLNTIFGFVDSFKSDFSCRICKVTQTESAIMCREDEKFLRTKSNYEKDSQTINPQKTGIKESCIFHNVHDFHITENVTVDMMHDVLEGVCKYVLQFIIYHYIFVKKYFTLEKLNERIQTFNFGPTEISNKPPVITLHQIKNKLNLKMSASEMLCLVRYFGLIVADMIPEDDEYWKLFKYLRKIVDIITSPRIIREQITYLEKLIEAHHKLFLKLQGRLKPKFHHLLHYPRILLNNGPSIHFWCMRFESRHRLIKAVALASSCTKNLLVTIATKEMLRMCEMINSMESDPPIKFGKPDDRKKTREYITNIKNTDKCSFFKTVEINGNVLKIGTFIVTDVVSIEKEFGEIEDILNIDEEIYLYVNIFDEVTFDGHYHAYVTTRSKKSKLVKFNDLPDLAPVFFINKNNTNFIAARYQL